MLIPEIVSDGLGLVCGLTRHIIEMCDSHVPAGQTLNYQVVLASGGKSSVTAQVVVPATPVTTEGCAAECQKADAVDPRRAIR